MRVALLGSSGFLGSHVVDELQKASVETIGMDIVTPRWNYPDLFTRTDVTDTEGLRAALMQVGPDVVIDLAGILGTAETFRSPGLTANVNVLGALNAMMYCLDANAVYIGVDTGSPEWLNPYAITKRAATDLARALAKELGLRATILRVFNAFGPRQAGTTHVVKIIPNFIRAALEERPVPIFGTGEQTVDLVSAEDCARAFRTAISSAPHTGEVIDVGSGQPRSVASVADLILNIVGRGSVIALPDRPGVGASTSADLTRCKQILGFTPQADLGTLPDVVAWYMNHGFEPWQD